jgi:hypothetical protein
MMKVRSILLLGFIVLLACKKEAGPGGKNTIKGTVTFVNGVSGSNDAAAMAQVSIAYGSSSSTTDFDKTVLANSDGSYSFEGLRKGDYFIKATYTDQHGFTYTDPGAIVTFNHRKKEAEANIILE